MSAEQNTPKTEKVEQEQEAEKKKNKQTELTKIRGIKHREIYTILMIDTDS